MFGACVQGFMLVYSITEDSSLEDLQSIHKQILNAHENQKVPIVVVANKSDLELTFTYIWEFAICQMMRDIANS